MRALSILCSAIIALLVLYFYLANSAGETGREELPIAFGKPNSQGVEINVAVSIFLPRKEPPPREHGVIMWDKWIDARFMLKDSTGARVPLRRANFSNLMNDRQSGGTPECWLKGFVKPGASYTFDFKPRLDGPTYRWEFTAPSQGAEAERIGFIEATR